MGITDKISHAAERKAFETIPDGKWAHYTQRLIRENDPYILKTFLTNAAYEGGFRGYQTAKHGRCLSIEDDFTLSDEKVGDYYTNVRRVLTNLFGTREVLAYVTSTARTRGTKRLFFSTISSEELQIFCAWQESSPLNQTGSDRMKYIPLFLYSFRWNIEISYYEQKTFWSLCSYMVRSCKGIEIMVNLINVAYCAMKLLPYQDESFSDFRDKSVQDFRFALSEVIRQQLFFATFVQNIETQIKSSSIINALKQAIVKHEHYL